MARAIRSIIEDAIAAGLTLEFYGPQPMEKIERVASRLDVVLPADLKEFLHSYGGGGLDGAWISGVSAQEDESTTIIGDTERLRSQFGLSPEYAVIYIPEGSGEAAWCVHAKPGSSRYGKVYAIDTYRECFATKLYDSFTDYLEDYFKLELEDG